MNNIEEASQYLSLTEQDNSQTLSDLVGVNVKDTPWCAAFVNAILKKQGIEGTNSNLARSFLTWGKDHTDKPQVGDIVVLTRGTSSWQGHVAFLYKYPEDSTMVYLLGGNQGDSVCIKQFYKHSIIGIRGLDD